MDDPEACFAYDAKLVMLEMVVVFVDGAGQGIFDRHDRTGRPAVLQAKEDIFEALAGKHHCAASAQPPRSLFAESAPFTLKCNRKLPRRALFFHFPSQRFTFSSGRPRRSRTRSR